MSDEADVAAGAPPARKKGAKKKAAPKKKKPTEPEKLAELRAFAKKKRLPFYPISAVTGAGVDELKYAMWEQVKKLRKKHVEAEDEPATLQVTERRRRPRDWR